VQQTFAAAPTTRGTLEYIFIGPNAPLDGNGNPQAVVTLSYGADSSAKPFRFCGRGITDATYCPTEAVAGRRLKQATEQGEPWACCLQIEEG
jgi:hypothetical protein